MSFETLRVYQAAQQLREEVDKLRPFLRRGFENEFKHVDEACDSILNNIPEGHDSKYPARRVNFYDIAAGSAREVRSGLRSLDRRKGFKPGAKVFRPIVLSLAISKMLKSLIAKEDTV